MVTLRLARTVRSDPCARSVRGICRAAALLCWPAVSFSADLGTVGKTYSIAESDLLASIRARLQALQSSGELDRMHSSLRERSRERIARPAGLYLPRAGPPAEVRSFNPAIVTTRDLYDHAGRLVAHAGTEINPLDHRSFRGRLVFLDGDDPVQVEWADRTVAADPQARIVLVRGSPAQRMRAWRRRVFFDQGGLLATRFQLNRVPAIVRASGRMLEVRTVPLPP